MTSFGAFTFDTVHRQFMDRGDEWHLPKTGPNLVMWWVAAGHRPSVAEAAARLDHLVAHGATDHAFDWSFAT